MQLERWLYPEMGRLMMILGIGCLSLSMLTGYLIKRIRGSFQSFSKSLIIYTIAYAAFFALVGLSIAIPWFSQYLYHFIFFQVLFAAAGTIHLFTMKRFLKWTGPGAFWVELLHLVVITLLGAICMVMTYRIINREGLDMAMATSVFFFIVPYFVNRTYLAALAIPPKIYREWHYPIHYKEQDFDDSKLRNLLVISFEFQKGPLDKYFTNFRAKAPVDMDFGELFYYFINDYNERHAAAPIRFSSSKERPHGWIFYKKPKWYTIFTKYIDTDKTVFINNIKENDVIICSRISQ